MSLCLSKYFGIKIFFYIDLDLSQQQIMVIQQDFLLNPYTLSEFFKDFGSNPSDHRNMLRRNLSIHFFSSNIILIKLIELMHQVVFHKGC